MDAVHLKAGLFFEAYQFVRNHVLENMVIGDGSFHKCVIYHLGLYKKPAHLSKGRAAEIKNAKLIWHMNFVRPRR
jgi:hypothetical protein